MAEVKRLCKQQTISIVSILETKVKPQKMQAIQKKFGTRWHWQCNYDYSSKGWLGWIDELVNVSVLQVNEQFIHSLVVDKQRSNSIHLTVVYGLHTIETRRALWRDFLNVAVTLSPWVGDFNTILATEDIINGAPVTVYETPDFEAFLSISEVPSTGFFTVGREKGRILCLD